MHRVTPVGLVALALLAACDDRKPAAGSAAAHGAAVIAEAGCGACHEIPGIDGARGRIGPSLAHVGARSIVAGILPNTQANLVAWVRAPQSIQPGNVMPDMELSEHDARDIVAYLTTLR